MPISGSDLAITPARSGILRSGAGRAGWPILQGAVVPLYALSNVARSGATRSGYVSPKTFIAIGGVQFGVSHSEDIEPGLTVSPRVLIDSLSITDGVDEQPNTASFTAMGFIPPVGAEIVLTLGSINNLSRLYAGTLLRTHQSFLVGVHAHRTFTCSLIDHTWGLNRRKVSGHYTGSATTIALALIAEYAADYTTHGIELGLPTVDGGITFTEQDLVDCLRQLAKRIGAVVDVDYRKDVSLRLTPNPNITAPSPLNRVNPLLLLDPPFTVDRDLSPFISRVNVEGGGGTALEAVAVGETILPVSVGDWYQAGGGTVKSGPQRITYTARILGGAGSLVGPGASPSAAPGVALASGSGIESGVHEWAVVFVTASGKSLAGPRTSVTVGLLAAPATAPTAGTPTVGTGPDPGTHKYAVTFQTAAGETTAGPEVTVATTLTAAPTTAPTPAASAGTGIEEGAHDYAYTHTTAIGETTATPISGQVVLGAPSDPAISAPAAPTVALDSAGILRGLYSYGVTFVNVHGETTLGSVVTRTASGLNPPTTPTTFDITPAYGTEITPPTAACNIDRTPSSGSGGVIYTWAFVYTFVNALGETTASPISTVDIYANTTGVALANIQNGGGNTTKRRVYRKRSDATDPTKFYFIAEIPNNTSTGLADAAVAENTGIVVPIINTTPNGPLYATYDYLTTFVNAAGETTAGPSMAVNIHMNTTRLDLEDIPLGPTGTTKRRLYRRSTDASDTAAYRPMTEIANNTTETLTSVPLGDFLPTSPVVPVTNTTGGDTHLLGNIPTGPDGVTARKIYRTIAGATGAHKYLGILANNSASSFTDNITDSSLGVDSPASNTTAEPATPNRIHVTGIANGGAAVTGKKLYRRSAGAGLKLVTSLGPTTTTYTDSTPNASLGAAVPVTNTAYLQRIPLTALPIGGALVTGRRLWGTAAGAAQLKLITTLNTTDTTYTVTTTDASLGANVPTSNTAAANQVGLTGIPIGAASVTAREIHRTAIGSAQLKLQQTIANNVDTTATDSTPDASLGANAPSSDTSGLTQPDGVVFPGSTSLISAGTAWAQAGGGWAIIGNGQQVIRYTGVSGSSITGIPATGVGAITAPVQYNSTVTQAPQLTGIPASGAGSVRFALVRGDDVNLFVVVDDLSARSALAALLTTADHVHDGIIEDGIQDRRKAYAESVADGTAHLAERNQINVEIHYATRDTNTRAGQTVSVNLGAPTNVIGDFIIQSVTIGSFHPTKNPVCMVTASSKRFSWEDLLRVLGSQGR